MHGSKCREGSTRTDDKIVQDCFLLPTWHAGQRLAFQARDQVMLGDDPVACCAVLGECTSVKGTTKAAYLYGRQHGQRIRDLLSAHTCILAAVRSRCNSFRRKLSLQKTSSMAELAEYTSRVYARIGLLGNPSDGMGGAALAVSISNFSASVKLVSTEDNKVEIEHDPSTFADIEEICHHTTKWGYYGGHRLLMVRSALLTCCKYLTCSYIAFSVFPTIVCNKKRCYHTAAKNCAESKARRSD
jgi:hypothetical protein